MTSSRPCGYIDIDASKTLFGLSLKSIVNFINAKKVNQQHADIENIMSKLSSVHFTSKFNYKFEKKICSEWYTHEIIYRFSRSVKELMNDVRDSSNLSFKFIDNKTCFMSCPLCYTKAYKFFRRGRALQLAEADGFDGDDESPCMVWHE